MCAGGVGRGGVDRVVSGGSAFLTDRPRMLVPE